MSASDFSGWRPSDAIIAEFDRIRRNSIRIKAFVARHGERSALIFARALSPSFQKEREFQERLVGVGRDDEFEEACAIVRAVGQDAASLLPQLVRGYYHPQKIDRYA
ncbi:MAG TPA: hypothetical protein VMW12_02750 [Candidatus Dormibacteraeota bacterium]|nr:hypothetical protein [Candidatus Dormibacteraeota bacterium]